MACRKVEKRRFEVHCNFTLPCSAKKCPTGSGYYEISSEDCTLGSGNHFYEQEVCGRVLSCEESLSCQICNDRYQLVDGKCKYNPCLRKVCGSNSQCEHDDW